MNEITRMMHHSDYFAHDSNTSDCDHKHKYPEMRTGDRNRVVSTSQGNPAVGRVRVQV